MPKQDAEKLLEYKKILVDKIHQIFHVLELRRKKTFLLIDFVKDLKV